MNFFTVANQLSSNWNVHNPATPAANMSHKNQEISILTIKKREIEVNTSSTSHREFQRRKDKTEKKRPRKKKKKKTRKQYEQQCQPHTCSGTIKSSMYDSDFSITTFPLTSSAP
jgi:protein subunit release factor B